MKLSQQDWRKLHFPIIALGITLIAMTLLVGTKSSHDAAGSSGVSDNPATAFGVGNETGTRLAPGWHPAATVGGVGE